MALFKPLQLGSGPGALTLAHRVVMAPLTRMRADEPGKSAWGLTAE